MIVDLRTKPEKDVTDKLVTSLRAFETPLVNLKEPWLARTDFLLPSRFKHATTQALRSLRIKTFEDFQFVTEAEIRKCPRMGDQAVKALLNRLKYFNTHLKA